MLVEITGNSQTLQEASDQCWKPAGNKSQIPTEVSHQSLPLLPSFNWDLWLRLWKAFTRALTSESGVSPVSTSSEQLSDLIPGMRSHWDCRRALRDKGVAGVVFRRYRLMRRGALKFWEIFQC